jgi:DNA-binding NtrC family response regulator
LRLPEAGAIIGITRHPVNQRTPLALKVLLLDADRAVGRTLEPELDAAELHTACGLTEGLRLIATGTWDLILLDADFSDAGMEILGRLRGDGGSAPVVLLSQNPSMDLALEAIRQGAHDVLPKPLPRGRVREILAGIEEVRRLRPLPELARGDTSIVGSSAGMMQVFKSIARAADSDATVLVLGESGTGKEMVARVLHSRSRRAKGPFVAINCAAIPENLLESELFGHEKGAFTGAIARKIGRWERAQRGTLLLDEIGDMSLALQAKILRAVQEREIERVGGEERIPVDVRVVAATHRNLRTAIAEGTFREDLYFRLAVVTLELPRLRDRGPDLDLLAQYFVARHAAQYGRPIRGIARSVFDRFREHDWPGNIRELRNVTERAVLMAHGSVLLPDHLPLDQLRAAAASAPAADDGAPLAGYSPDLDLAAVERLHIREVLRRVGGHMGRASEVLGVHRNTLTRKVREYGLEGSASPDL